MGLLRWRGHMLERRFSEGGTGGFGGSEDMEGYWVVV
jgi:hypothetical protein